MFAALASVTSGAACTGGTVSPSVEQPGEGDDGPFPDEIVAKTDAAIEREIATAAEGAIYMSEADFPFTLVKASLSPEAKRISVELVREKLAPYVDEDPYADKPLATLKSMTWSWAEWRRDFAQCADREGADPGQCPRITRMNDAIARNLRGVKMFFFGAQGEEGHVEGTSVSIFIVGRTPRGALLGVRTVAVWT